MRHVLAAAAAMLAIPLMSANVAHAQQPAQPAADAPLSADRTGEQIDAWLNEPVHGVAPTQDAPPETPVRDRAIHGEVGAAIGSNGYRSAYGVATMPLGPNSDVTVAVAGGHSDGFKTRDGQRWGGGDTKSLAISLRLGSGGGGFCSVPRWGMWVPSDYGRTDHACAAPPPQAADLRRRPLLTHEDDVWNDAPAF